LQRCEWISNLSLVSIHGIFWYLQCSNEVQRFTNSKILCKYITGVPPQKHSEVWCFLISIYVMVFWVMTPYSDMVWYQFFRGSCCLHLPTSQYGVITQKTTTWIFITVKILSPPSYHYNKMELEFMVFGVVVLCSMVVQYHCFRGLLAPSSQFMVLWNIGIQPWIIFSLLWKPQILQNKSNIMLPWFPFGEKMCT
jgi:hypothetical protein